MVGNGVQVGSGVGLTVGVAEGNGVEVDVGMGVSDGEGVTVAVCAGMDERDGVAEGVMMVVGDEPTPNGVLSLIWLPDWDVEQPTRTIIITSSHMTA